jgi:hypothetical protein
MQHVKYPLPPLMLGPIIEKCAEDHTHKHSEFCATEDAEYCGRTMKDNEQNITPVIVDIEAGYGRHECDNTCKTHRTHNGDQCFRSCEDSDWVVTLQYSSKGWQAVYGIMRAGDVQDILLWAD